MVSPQFTGTNHEMSNNGTKICDYKKWNSKYQDFMNFDHTV